MIPLSVYLQLWMSWNFCQSSFLPFPFSQHCYIVGPLAQLHYRETWLSNGFSSIACLLSECKWRVITLIIIISRSVPSPSQGNEPQGAIPRNPQFQQAEKKRKNRIVHNQKLIETWTQSVWVHNQGFQKGKPREREKESKIDSRVQGLRMCIHSGTFPFSGCE